MNETETRPTGGGATASDRRLARALIRVGLWKIAVGWFRLIDIPYTLALVAPTLHHVRPGRGSQAL